MIPSGQISVEEFLPMANQVAVSIWQRGGRTCEVEELKGQAGLILVRALRSHDPARGPLASHIKARLKYDLLSYLRDRSPLTAGHRARIKSGQAVPVTHIPLSVPGSNGEEFTLPIAVADPSLEQNLAALQIDALARSVRFTRQERKVFERLRAGEGEFPVIACELGVSPSRISQIYRAVIQKLKWAKENPDYAGIFCLNCERRLPKRGSFCDRRCSAHYFRPLRAKVTDEQQLRELYLGRKMSCAKIAGRLGCSRGAVWKALRWFQIPRRPARSAPRTACMRCGRPVYKSARCRRHFNLYNNWRAVKYRKLSPWTPEKRTLQQKKVWETRRERYGVRGSKGKSAIPKEVRTRRARAGWETRQQNLRRLAA